jgi:hypothetical protein
MKSTNNSQTTEAVKKNAIAPTWQSHIVEDLSSEAQAAVSGGGYPNNTVNSPEEFWKAVWKGLGSGAGIG